MYYYIYVHGGKTTYTLSKFNHTILRHLKTNKQKQNRFKIFNSFYRNLLKQQRIKCVQLDFLCVTCFLPVMDKSLLPPAYCEEPEVISQDFLCCLLLHRAAYCTDKTQHFRKDKTCIYHTVLSLVRRLVMCRK